MKERNIDAGELIFVWDEDDAKDGKCTHAGWFKEFGNAGDSVFVRHEGLGVSVEWWNWAKYDCAKAELYFGGTPKED